jgi:hypothetical protein
MTTELGPPRRPGRVGRSWCPSYRPAVFALARYSAAVGPFAIAYRRSEEAFAYFERPEATLIVPS